MKKIGCLMVLLPLFTSSFGQTVITEFDLQGGHVGGIQAFPVSDSIFLSFSHRQQKKTYWVNNKGKQREINMKVAPNALIVGIKVQGDRTLYYYYLNDINGQLVLQAMHQTDGSSELAFGGPIFPIPGELLGIYVDKAVLTVASYLKKENRVRILTIDGLRIVHEAFFDMPFDISRHIKANSGFIVGSDMISFHQAEKKFKLYREGNNVVATIDQSLPGLENRKTTIIRMNVVEGSQQVYTLQRKDYDKFVSFYFEGKVYQMSHSPKKYIRCDAFDIKSGKMLFTKTFGKDKSMQKEKVIVHRGKSVEVGYSTLYEMVNVSEEPVPSMIVQRMADSTQVRLILAAVHYYSEEAYFIPLPLPFLDPALLIVFFISPINSNVRYITLTGNTEAGFRMDPLENNQSPSIRQRIDEYEISQTSGRAKGVTGWDLLFKGYAEMEDGVLGIYSLKGKKIMLVKYPSNNPKNLLRPQ